MIVQLAFPFQVVLAGNTVQGNLSDLKAGQVSMGEVPKNTPEYYESLCASIESVEDGSVQAKDSTGATQNYKLADACKSTNLGKLTNEMRINCTLFEATKTSQVKAYCDARKLAMKAKKGVDLSYKMDIAAAGTCWAEYLMIKAAQSSGIAAGVSKATNGKICGTASMAAGLVEVGTTASMLFQKKGKKVSSDGTVSGRDDLTLYGGMIASMGIGVLGVNYGRCLLNIGVGSIGGCGTTETKSSGALKQVAEKGKEVLNNHSGDGASRNPASGGGDSSKPSGDNKNTPYVDPCANKIGPAKAKCYQDNVQFTPKDRTVIDPIEIITAMSRENPEFREAIITTLQGDYYDQWKRESFKDSFARLSMEIPPIFVACGVGEISVGGICAPIKAPTNYKPITINGSNLRTPANVNTQVPTFNKANSNFLQNHKIENGQYVPKNKWDKMGDTFRKENNIGPEGITPKTDMQKRLEKANENQKLTNQAIEKNEHAAKAPKEKTSIDQTSKEKLIMKAALAFTALAAMRYLTRNNAKKTQENAEHFLGSMINSAPTTGGPTTYTTGGGLRVGNGYVGGGPAPNNGDQSGITAGGPEDILAPRGSPQRGAFEKVASQIPNSVLDSPPGSAIGQIAGAMGSNGGLVAAHADDVAKSALAALGSSNDIYATESGGSGGHSGKSDGGGLNLNLGGLGGEQEQGGTEGEMAFRGPAMNCSEDIYHSQCKANMNMFQIVSDRYSRQPIAK